MQRGIKLFEFNPQPKPSHNRRVQKRKNRGEFPPKVRKQIIDEQNGVCQICGLPTNEIHHVYLKSRGGRGVVTNGMLACVNCHIPKIHNKSGMVEHYIQKWIEKHGENFYKDKTDLQNN